MTAAKKKAAPTSIWKPSPLEAAEYLDDGLAAAERLIGRIAAMQDDLDGLVANVVSHAE
jgi:hypothetical protein